MGAMEALLLKRKVKWRENSNWERCLADFGWGGLRLDIVKGMSNADVKYMLKRCAWRKGTTMWAEELEERPKLCVLMSWLEEDWKLDVWE